MYYQINYIVNIYIYYICEKLKTVENTKNKNICSTR